MSSTVIKDLEKISSHFGRGADTASLTKGVVTGPQNINEAISVLTDTAKVVLSYAEDLGRKTGVASLATNGAAFWNAVRQMRNDYNTNGVITLGPALKSFASLVDSAGTVLLAQPTPQGKLMGLLFKGGAAGLGYLELGIGDKTVYEKTQTLNTLSEHYRQVDRATNGNNDTQLHIDRAGAGIEIKEFSASKPENAVGVQISPSSGPALVVSRLNNRFEVSETFDVYTVQSGDTVSGLAQRYGLSPALLLKSNPHVTNPNQIFAGEQLKLPRSISDGNASTAPKSVSIGANQFYIDDAIAYDGPTVAFFTGVSLSKLVALNPNIDFNNLKKGQVLTLPAPDNSKLTLGTATGAQALLPGAEAEGALANLVNAGYAFRTPDSWAQLPVSTLNGDGYWNTELSALITDDFRPGNGNLSDALLNDIADDVIDDILNDPSLYNIDTGFILGGGLNNWSLDARATTYVDPLVLDLNGDGVRLTDYGSNPVLFDIDNDGGSLEQTGWTTPQDGILVMDRNGNGRIDDISETFSEYFAGVTGTGGNAGTKPYRDGFAALKSQDSNNDNLFTSSDAAFNNVRVWIDSDHDGKTDAGELKTLAELSITQIDLNAQTQSGAVRDGNEILAAGRFIQGGQTKEALALNFLANPNGHTFVTSGSGTTTTTQGGMRSYTAGNPAGEVIDVTAKSVDNAYGAQGKDTLIGNAANNWLAGGAGSDSFNAGAGDDVLLIDADDLQQNIRAGAGTDIAQVIGDQGVTLNLAQAEIEVAVGGRGHDVFVSGGNANTFVRAGDGDDLLLGGSANDALSGENGEDVIDGGAGNDLLRGHRGRDRILGGTGDDIMEGGQDDDTLSGGVGNDVITGGRGDDRIDGGVGVDLAKYAGNYADYRITRTEQGAWVSDKTGRDGTDFLVEVENINFADIGTISLTQPNPLPVDDVVAVPDRTSARTISKAQLLGNDIDYQNDALRISEIFNVYGGAAALTAEGNVLFTPDPNYKGIMSFKYKIADGANNPGLTLRDPASGATAELRAQVTLKTPDMPNDPHFIKQGYLSDINALPVWQDYTGKGVRVGVFEPGGQFAVGPEVLDYRHPDLAPNVDPVWLGRDDLPTTFSNHTTAVAGVIAAARNDEGTVGVAYGAKIGGHALLQSGTPDLSEMKNYDVVNNSWGSTGRFTSKITPPDRADPGIGLAITQGRGGLGTVVVFAAGNDRATGGNTNYDVLTSGPFTITVGATNPTYDGDVSVATTTFSSPGSSILVSAPGSYVDTSSRELVNDNGSTFGKDHAAVSGTSFATPMVSGVVALMLEANPNLGYRDVQEILALTATMTNNSGWRTNGARTWNGGGMHVSHDYGFGQVDARAAVRLAETWTQPWMERKTYAKIKTSSRSSGLINLTVPDGASLLSNSLTMEAGTEVEYAQVVLNIDHQRWGDLVVKLISPNGTESVLINRPGKAPGSAANVYGDTGTFNLNYALGSTHYRGEESGGTWTLQVYDAATGQTGVLKDWKLTLLGKPVDGNDTYVYTDEFATLASTARTTLSDDKGEFDTLNVAAVSGNNSINLAAGANSVIAGRTITIASGTVIENAVGGDGHDVLAGNEADNDLSGGRGNDTLYGNGGIDFLDGGKGNDTLYGGADRDYFVIRKQAGAQDVIADFSVSQVGEKLILFGFDNLQDFSQIGLTQEGANLRLNLGGGQNVLLLNTSASQFKEQNVLLTQDSLGWMYVYLTGDMRWPLMNGGSSLGESYPTLDAPQGALFMQDGNDSVLYNTGWHFIDGGDGDDTVLSASSATGHKWIEGGAGNDWLEGGTDTRVGVIDVLRGGSGHDRLMGNGGTDFLEGGAGSDLLFGDDGDDILLGGTGVDLLKGGKGDDVISLEGDTGEMDIDSSGFSVGIGRGVAGGPGSDWFVVEQQIGPGVVRVITIDPFGNKLVMADNLIEDFDINDPNEKIDLSAIGAVSGFQDLEMREGFAAWNFRHRLAQIKAGEVSIHLYNVDYSALKPDHFIFAKSNAVVGRTLGNDTLTGDAGGNHLDGLVGADVLTGRTGDDTYVVDNVGDVVNELPDGGFDTVRSSVSFALPADVENLILTGVAAINGTGNAHVNRIEGNAAANRLDGGAGEDTLIGGAGNDVYVVDNTADRVVERAAGGYDAVESSVSYTLPDEVEKLTLMGNLAVNATGNELNNVLVGNVNANTLDGGAGADNLTGGDGDDTYLVDNAGDTVNEAADQGVDTVHAALDYTLPNNVENLILGIGVATGTGNALDNVITGNGINNTLAGGAGNDVLDGKGGADMMVGAVGDDIYYRDNTSDVISENANQGIDTVYSSLSYTLATNIENLTLTGVGAINATGNAANNVLIGNSAANTLSGGTGADMMIGSAGNDTYVVDNTGDVVIENANEGIDLVHSSVTYTLTNANVENLTLTGAGAINATGNTANNVLTGNSANNTLTGGDGNDTLDGKSGADTMVGGRGNDIYYRDNTSDVITESANQGTDTVQSSLTYVLDSNLENLTLTGTGAINATGNVLNNVLIGNSANNTLSGGDGNDTLDGKGGADMMIGGAGNDIYVVDNTADVVIEILNEGIDFVQSSVTYTLTNANVETLTLTGTTAINGTGNAFNNVLTGNSAVNTLTGGNGNDTLDGKGGADMMVGGAGNDIYIVDNAADVVTENLNEGIDLVQSSVNYTLTNANVENLTLTGTTAINGTGNALNNVLTGNSAVNTLTGGDGNDTLDGGAGADTMVGGLGNDIYYRDNTSDVITEGANQGTDTVYSALTYTLVANVENLMLSGTSAINGTGNSANNTLTGNSAANTLTGGTGNDTYMFGRGHAADTVVENDATAGNTDIASFMSGIATDQLWFQRTGNNLNVSIIGTSDRMTVQNWYLGNAYHVEQFKTADGKTLLNSRVDNLVNAMASFAPPPAGQTTLPPDYQTQLNPVIAANWQ